MKKESLQKAVMDVLQPFNKYLHRNNPMGSLHDALEEKAKEFSFKVDLAYPIQHINYGETSKRVFDITDENDENLLHVHTSTYRGNQSGSYEVTAYTSPPEKQTKKSKPRI
jgi:hypothetical protein